jgi:hypothetical protein
MTNDLLQQSIDELEVSVRTAGFLQSLEVSTIGELLELPVIRAPHRLVAAELAEIFDELELGYSGDIVVDRPMGSASTWRR